MDSEREELEQLRNELREALERERIRDEREEVERIRDKNVVDVEFELWRGNKSKKGNNPGKLIVGMKEKFLFNRQRGNSLHSHCTKKETLNSNVKVKQDFLTMTASSP